MSNHVSGIPGSPEKSYKMMYSYLYMLKQVNPGTKTCVKLDDASKFKYLFIALGACIEGFAFMRKVIAVDATSLKNKYGGVLVFAEAQDPNGQSYPLAFAVLDSENLTSWTWFFEMLKSVIPDSSELVFMSERNQSLIFAIGSVFPEAHHGHCLWHLKEKVKWHAGNVNKVIVGHKFMELGRYYTVDDFNSAYDSFEKRYPAVYKYVQEHTEKDKWARVFLPRDRYNFDTINSVESMKSVFKEATTWALIPMLDCIVRKFSDWFTQRKEAVSRSIDTSLVPLVENYLHGLWDVAQKLSVREINSYELKYEITDTAGKMFWASLVEKSCTCKVWDYEKFPCLHGLAAYIYFTTNVDGGLNIHELCSKYYWTELWALAYDRTLCVVPDMSSWNVPDQIKEVKIIPPDRIRRKGRKRVG
ncbi:protein FAR-RED ELONGATED HYPOCOTYL 3-like [Raphanus sativus]|uniref:Protein FAR-RED ELONGATED HYPOCOTYL 3-like n=1 Tax=Raphanus sativus TaxID=3726 RepID=A0A9W3CSF2_RAPSA|nr:protein FAR-RED ELONGATED HYPOCOTYL 3-like [Raphanus sativus]